MSIHQWFDSIKRKAQMNETDHTHMQELHRMRDVIHHHGWLTVHQAVGRSAAINFGQVAMISVAGTTAIGRIVRLDLSSGGHNEFDGNVADLILEAVGL